MKKNYKRSAASDYGYGQKKATRYKYQRRPRGKDSGALPEVDLGPTKARDTSKDFKPGLSVQEDRKTRNW